MKENDENINTQKPFTTVHIAPEEIEDLKGAINFFNKRADRHNFQAWLCKTILLILFLIIVGITCAPAQVNIRQRGRGTFIVQNDTGLRQQFTNLTSSINSIKNAIDDLKVENLNSSQNFLKTGNELNNQILTFNNNILELVRFKSNYQDRYFRSNEKPKDTSTYSSNSIINIFVSPADTITRNKDELIPKIDLEKQKSKIAEFSALFILGTFLILFFLRLSRYHFKMRDFYQSRANALMLYNLRSNNEKPIEPISLKDALALTSTSNIDFKIPKFPKDELIDLFKTQDESKKASCCRCCCNFDCKKK